MLTQQQEKIQVFSLFKELMQIINSHSQASIKIHTDQQKSTTISKELIFHSEKKQGVAEKYCKETQSVQGSEKSMQKPLKVKGIKKQISKQVRKEVLKEQQSKLKQQIFNDYSSIMTYKIHNKQINIQKRTVQPFSGRRALSIIRNLTLTIQPSQKQESSLIQQ